MYFKNFSSSKWKNAVHIIKHQIEYKILKKNIITDIVA